MLTCHSDRSPHAWQGVARHKVELSWHWLADQRGVAMLTYAVVLPLFLLLIFGFVQVWKVMAVRQSLRLGTYQAVRALSWQGRSLVADPVVTPARWGAAAQPVAEAIVAAEVARNNLAGGGVPQVAVEPPAVADCEEVYALEGNLSADALVFSVEGWLDLPWPVKIPFVQPVIMTLKVRHLGFLECPEGWNRQGPGPPPEGHAY